MKFLLPRVGLLLCVVAVCWPQPSLDRESSARLLERSFPDTAVEYILLDARTGDLLTSRWDSPDRPVPLGSLVKPFTALAYGEEHGFQYPEVECHGKRDRCWYARGHGQLGLVQAVAQSCNAYFLNLASDLRPSSVTSVLRRYSIYDVNEKVSPDSMVGLGSAWKISPIRMLRAYAELSRRRDQPGVSEIIRGMQGSEVSGTGMGVGTALRKSGQSAITKTGTAPCAHSRNGSVDTSLPQGFAGDGYVIALYPAADPRFALIVRMHSAPGSKAAEVAGKMLRTIADGK